MAGREIAEPGLRAAVLRLLSRLATIGVRPDESEELRARKATLTLSASTVVVLSFVWVVTYAALGLPVPGVIGRREFIYDLWGDTVNTASRMESAGVPGRVQVTEATRARLASSFELEPRGLVPIKGKGDLPAFLLVGPRASVHSPA